MEGTGDFLVPVVKILDETDGGRVRFRVIRGRVRLGFCRVKAFEGVASTLRTFLVEERQGGEFVGQSLQEQMTERRAVPRIPCSLKVASAQLPGRIAEARDFSLQGLRIKAGEPVDEGVLVPLSLHLDASSQLKLRGEVRWCRPSEGGYELGVRLVRLRPRHRQALSKLRV
ncbi:MAG: PilZ domain-containing protein [Vulcanimicrobiota bacterium]